MSRKTRKCKECGKEFNNEYLSRYCKECLSIKKRNEMKQFYKENGGWKRKLKWMEKLVLVKVKMPAVEDWNNGFNPAVTRDVCTYCKEIHYEDQVYYHPYMKEAYVFGLSLLDVEELIDEIKKELRNGKTTKECMELRGMDTESIIKNELKDMGK